MTDRQEEPATEAGRTMLDWLRFARQRTGAAGIPDAAAIIAIEREALKLDVVDRSEEGQPFPAPLECDDPAGHLAALCDCYLEAEGAWHEFVNLVYRLIPDGDIRGPIIGAAARLSSSDTGRRASSAGTTIRTSTVRLRRGPWLPRATVRCSTSVLASGCRARSIPPLQPALHRASPRRGAMTPIQRFKEEYPDWADYPDEVVEGTYAFAWWRFGQELDNLGRLILDDLRRIPLLGRVFR